MKLKDKIIFTLLYIVMIVGFTFALINEHKYANIHKEDLTFVTEVFLNSKKTKSTYDIVCESGNKYRITQILADDEHVDMLEQGDLLELGLNGNSVVVLISNGETIISIDDCNQRYAKNFKTSIIVLPSIMVGMILLPVGIHFLFKKIEKDYVEGNYKSNYVKINEVVDEEASKLHGISFLAQGTIYPDIIESDGVKAHHNVGGLPEDMQFELVEPVRLLYKDEVRMVGRALGLPSEMVDRQPFPGPGLGVRCLGAITRDRLHALRESDAILREEFDKTGLTSKVWQFFTVVPDFRTTGVKNGKRAYDWPVIIRAVNTVDAMVCSVPEIEYAVLKKITERILNEVDGVCRVLYDLSPKPSATIEWE